MVKTPYSPIIIRIGRYELLFERIGRLFDTNTWPRQGFERLSFGERLFWFGPYHFAVCSLK